jgi:hypothetical protein
MQIHRLFTVRLPYLSLSTALIFLSSVYLLSSPSVAQTTSGEISLADLQKMPTLTGAHAEIKALLDHTDDLNRGRSSHSEITLKVHNPRYQRALKMKVWTKGTTHSLIRITSPKREAGMATLKVNYEAWNYMPNLDRTLKISTSAMGGSWMGSHFTNDDLVRGVRLSEAYTWELKAQPEMKTSQEARGHYIIYLEAKPNAPVVWGSLILEINAQKVPLRMRYFNERGRLVRTLSFHDIREGSGELIPFKMRIEPKSKRGKVAHEWTELTYDSLVFNVDLSRSLFSLRALKQ